jgi:GMP synthase (glutamine-hydrolysing)
VTTGIDATQVDPRTPATPVEPTAPAARSSSPPGVGVGEPPIETIVVLDFGSQYSQLITRRIREVGVYSELVHHDTPWAGIERLAPRGVILSGGPASVYEEGAPQLPDWVLASGLPVLGICYGMQLIARASGGSVDPATRREYGLATITTEGDSPLFAVCRAS